ncbi:MAG: hypothetical protein ABIG96_00485 [Candidatus Micrarchaeota archaeon]
MKNSGLTFYILMISLLVMFFLFGCIQTDQRNAGFQQGQRGQFGGRGNFSGGMNGTFGNMTEEQRVQFELQRLKEAADACSGKAEGDPCSIASQRGVRNATCKNQDSQLVCETPFPSARSELLPA